MPELPEVETIRLQLDKVLKGLKITEVEVLTGKSFVGPPSLRRGGASEEQGILGKKVVGVRRRGKITIIELEGGVCLAIHLKLTGQLIYRENQRSKIKDQNQNLKFKTEQKDGPFEVKDLPNKFTRVIISFDNGGKLYFNDLRIFGWIKIISQKSKIKDQSQNSKLKNFDEDLEFGKLGPEANNPETFTFDYFRGILAKSRKPVKIVLMDQEKIAGIGNIYTNESLFMAGILPTRKGSELSEEEIKILREAILKVLREAIEHKGSSDRDEAYRQITGEKGTHQNYLQVYGKAGQKCPKCGGVIKRVALGGRGTFYCEKCQK